MVKINSCLQQTYYITSSVVVSVVLAKRFWNCWNGEMYVVSTLPASVVLDL